MGQPGRTDAAAYPRYAAPVRADRPMPPTVRRAVQLMRVGAELALANGFVTALLGILGWHSRFQPVDGSTNVNQSAFETGYIFALGVSFLIPVGLWLWMAHANKAGKNWARITGTVFFGISCLVMIGSLSIDAVSGTGLAGAWTLVPLLITVLNWIVGLFTVILLWNKKSAPHFAPTPMPYPVPGPAPSWPVQPPSITMDSAAPLPPAADPWSVPGGQA